MTGILEIATVSMKVKEGVGSGSHGAIRGIPRKNTSQIRIGNGIGGILIEITIRPLPHPTPKE